MPQVDVDFVGVDKGVLENAKKIQSEMDQLSATLKESGVSQSAYNKAVAQSEKELKIQQKALEDSKQAVDDSGMSWTEFRSIYSTVLEVFNTGKQIVQDLYGEYSKLAESIRDVSLVSGTGAEETSRFLQVIDDFQLTAEDAIVASKALKEKGLTPTIDTLAMLADKFKTIEDPAKRLEFVQENLGKGGAKWVNVLNQESDALRESAALIDERLIMSDKQIAEYEQQRLALDALSDSWTAAKVSAGAFFGEIILSNQVMTRAIDIFEESGRQYDSHSQYTQEFQDALIKAREEQEAQTQAMLDNKDAAAQNEQAVEDLIAQQKELSNTLSKQIGLINSMQAAEDSYTEKSKDLTEQRADAEAELASLRAQYYDENSTQVQGALEKLDEIKEKEAELETERARQSLQFISNILAENLARDGWTESEFDAFAKQQEAWGLWSADVVAKSKAAWEEADKITASINAIPTEKNVTITVTEYNAGSAANESGTVFHGHASGGQFMIPMSYGNEGFRMGNGDTASGGETVTITPRGQQAPGGLDDESKGLLRQIANNRLNENKLALLLGDIITAAGR